MGGVLQRIVLLREVPQPRSTALWIFATVGLQGVRSRRRRGGLSILRGLDDRQAVGRKPKPAPAKASTAAAKSPVAGAKSQASAYLTAKSKSRPATEPLDDGSDPFEVDTRAVVKAPPVRPKPAKGRMLRVVCPMCETPGFISPQLQGKEVKCCNSDCMMPIFTAPKPKEKPVRKSPGVRPPASSSRSRPSSWFWPWEEGCTSLSSRRRLPSRRRAWTHQRPPTGDGEQVDTPQLIAPSQTTTGLSRSLSTRFGTPRCQVEKYAQRNRDNRSKPYGRRMAAEAFAGAGRLDQAREQLADMRRVQGYVPYYEIEPLVMIAQALGEQGDADAARKTLDDALSKADLPAHGREPLDAASRLATALMADGRTEDARGVAGLADDSGTRGRAFALWRHALDTGSLDLNASAGRPYLHDMPSAQSVSVTLGLLAQGHSEDALAWARGSGEPGGARQRRRRGLGGSVGRCGTAGRRRSGAGVGQCSRRSAPADRASAGLGGGGGCAAVATRTPQQHRSACRARRPRSNRCRRPIRRSVCRRSERFTNRKAGPEPASPIRWNSRAPRWLLRTPLRSRRRPGISMRHGVRCSEPWRTCARRRPVPAATQALLDECERERSSVQSRLQSALDIDEDRVFLAFNRYRKQCGVLHEQATARFELQVSLLRRAAAFGVLAAALGRGRDAPATFRSC